MRKLFIFAVLFIQANAYCSTNFLLENGYIGANLIKDNQRYKFKRNEQSPTVYFLDFDQFDWSGEGEGGEIYLGYHYKFKERLNVALEVFYDRSDNTGDILFIDDNSLYTRELTGKYRQRWQYGVALMPGYYLTPRNLFYGRIGWLTNNIKLTGAIVQTGLLGSFSGSFSPDQNKEGVQLGLGMQMRLVSRLALRVEWDWNQVRNFSTNSRIRSSEGLQFVTFRTAFHPELEQIKLGINWEFC